MKAIEFGLVLVLAAGATAAFAAPDPASQPSDPVSRAARGDASYGERSFVVQNQRQKHQLASQGFPQYTN